MRIGNNGYSANVIVGKERNGKLKLYDIVNITSATIKPKEMDTAIAANPSPGAGRSTVSISEGIVPDSGRNVKQYSIGETTDGRLEAVVDDDILAGMDVLGLDNNNRTEREYTRSN